MESTSDPSYVLNPILPKTTKTTKTTKTKHTTYLDFIYDSGGVGKLAIPHKQWLTQQETTCPNFLNFGPYWDSESAPSVKEFQIAQQILIFGM